MAATALAWTVLCALTINADGSDGSLLIEQMPSLLAGVPGRAATVGLVTLVEQLSGGESVVGIEVGTGSGWEGGSHVGGERVIPRVLQSRAVACRGRSSGALFC